MDNKNMPKNAPLTREVKLEDFFTRVLAVIGKTTDLEIANLLKDKNQTISAAESVTAGMICSRLANVPGSTDYFIGGVVCYHNRAKVMELGISPSLISKHGAISKEVTIAMANAIRNRLKTDIGISITGVAGPKPEGKASVGTVFIGLSTENKSQWKELHLQGTRTEIRKKAAQAALGLLWLYLGGDSAALNMGE